MQFLALARMRTDLYSDDDFKPLLDDEAEQARTLYMEGTVRQIWYRGDQRGACSILEAESEDAARAAIESLPLVKAGMLELVHLIPLLPYRGFGPRDVR
jgi:muconolactone delta-isomerase